jgi:hypothetical protein
MDRHEVLDVTERKIQAQKVQSSVTMEGSKIIIVGSVLALGSSPQTIRWRAPAPCTRGLSFSGSGFPHPNQEQAYDVRSENGIIESNTGEFRIVLNDMPGAYYSGLGSIYVPPHVELDASSIENKHWKGTILIREYDVPFRWISGSPPGMPDSSNPDVGRAMFHKWNPDGGVRSQEAILRSRGFPVQ